MYPILLHIYGPISIYSFGTALALGVSLYTYLTVSRVLNKKILTSQQFFTIATWTIVAGFVGGKVLAALQESTKIIDIFSLNTLNSGFSISGTLIAALLTLMLFLQYYKKPILKTLDALVLFAPLAHFFGRIGCFCAGCCFGKATNAAWGITYTHPASFAPLHCTLHPTQLYSALSYILIFIVLWFAQSKKVPIGTVTGLYIGLAALERFAIDFFRADQTLYWHGLSSNQWISLALAFAAGVFLILCICNKRTIKKYKKTT